VQSTGYYTSFHSSINTIPRVSSTPLIVGIDEVGRGCWAGPVVAGAVLLSRPIPGLADSKVLSKKRREILAEIIQNQAIAYGIGWVEAAVVDREGITAAVREAMRCALEAIQTDHDEVIIDGHFNFLDANPKVHTLIKADALIPSVSAASIIAKVARDNYMAEMAIKFPHYGFEKHVGYGTAAHLQALMAHGPCSLHRMSFKPLKQFATL
jgi:ribonuclease HII